MRENRFKSDTNADSSNNKKDGSPFNDEFDGLGVVNKMNNNLVGTVNTFQSDSSLIIPPDFSNLHCIQNLVKPYRTHCPWMFTDNQTATIRCPRLDGMKMFRRDTVSMSKHLHMRMIHVS